MNLKDYIAFAKSIWLGGNLPEKPPIVPPEKLRELFIMTSGLSGETGEVIEHIKKAVRDHNLDRSAFKKELGDMFYYWVMICEFFGFDPSDVIDTNVAKLTDRHKRGVLRGDGDNR